MTSEGRSSALRSNIYRNSHSEAGQAFIEYILILMVIVILLLSAIWRLSTAYRNYSTNLFGNYFACLLETGELPGIADSICGAEYQKFSLQTGIEKRKFNEEKPKPVRVNTAVRITPSERPEPVISRTDVVSGGSNTAGRLAGGDGGGKSAGKINDSRIQSVSLATDLTGVRTNVGTVNMPPGYFTQMSYVSEEDDAKEKQKKKERPVRSSAGSSEEDQSASLRKGKFYEPIKKAKDYKKKDEEGGDISIGALLRLFLIVCIVLALLLLIGGQLMQISKSMEKG